MWTPHLETDLEIIEEHLCAGDTVDLLSCNMTVPICDANPTRSLDLCFSCIAKRQAGLKLLSSRVKQYSLPNFATFKADELHALKMKFESIEELKSYQFRGFDLGYAVLSSLVSMTREPQPDLDSAEVKAKVQQLAVAAARMFLAFDTYLAHNQVDRVYVYNGRYAGARAILRASQIRGVDCYCHERGSTLDKYELYVNCLPHDRKRFVRELEAAWRNADEGTREQIAAAFFEQRRGGAAQSWYSFVDAQEQGRLPAQWDRLKRNVILYISSEDEFVAIGREWEEGKIYATQGEGIVKIAHDLKDDPTFHFYVRVHPNLSALRNSQTAALASIELNNVTIIKAESRVSTYTLMDQCEKVVVFGSSMGVEATYAGKPAILCSSSYYKSLGIAYEPRCHREVLDLVRASLPPMPRIAALKYGFYVGTFGRDFRHFKATAVQAGSFKGVEIRPGRLVSVAWKVLAWVRYPTRFFRRLCASALLAMRAKWAERSAG